MTKQYTIINQSTGQSEVFISTRDTLMAAYDLLIKMGYALTHILTNGNAITFQYNGCIYSLTSGYDASMALDVPTMLRTGSRLDKGNVVDNLPN